MQSQSHYQCSLNRPQVCGNGKIKYKKRSLMNMADGEKKLQWQLKFECLEKQMKPEHFLLKAKNGKWI